MTDTRRAWPIYKAVARKDTEILVADEAFAYGHGLRGVTGTYAYGVTKAMIDEKRADKSDNDVLRELAREMETTITSLRTMPMDEWLEWSFETPDPRVIAAVRALPGYDEATYPRIATNGGGRCFGHRIIRPRQIGAYTDPPYEPIDADLLKKINDYDDGITEEWTP